MTRVLCLAALVGAGLLMVPGAPVRAQGHGGWRGDPHRALGRTWDETESGWTGLWRRRPGTDVFDAQWRHPSGEREAATLRIEIHGDDVFVERRQRRGQCTYEGRLHRDGRTVTGTYECDWSGGSVPWRATIRD